MFVVVQTTICDV